MKLRCQFYKEDKFRNDNILCRIYEFDRHLVYQEISFNHFNSYDFATTDYHRYYTVINEYNVYNLKRFAEYLISVTDRMEIISDFKYCKSLLKLIQHDIELWEWV